MRELGNDLLDAMTSASNGLFEAGNRVELYDAVSLGCAALGFDLFTLSCHRPRGREVMLDPTFSNLSAGFLRDYDQLNWYEDDSLAARAIAGERPSAWNNIHDRLSECRKQSYFDFLQSSAIGCGVVIPLVNRSDTVSMLGLASGKDRRIGQHTILAASLMATAAMAKAEMLGLGSVISADEAIGSRLLSGRQAEILNWIAEGKSNLDIATIMGIEERTVRYHVSEILRKFGVVTRTQAAAIVRANKQPRS